MVDCDDGVTMTPENCKLGLPVRATASLLTDDDCNIAAGSTGYVTTHSSDGIGEYDSAILGVLWGNENFSIVHPVKSRIRVVHHPGSCCHSSMDEIVIHRH